MTNTRSSNQYTVQPLRLKHFGEYSRLSIHIHISNDMHVGRQKINDRPHMCYTRYWESLATLLFTRILHCKSITHILFLAFYYFSLRSMVSSVVLLHSTPAVSITSTATVIKLASSFSSTMVISVMLPTLLQLLPTQSPMKSTTWEP